MILTIMLWLGMQGWQCFVLDVIGRHIICPVNIQSATDEHVFEIRTKREERKCEHGRCHGVCPEGFMIHEHAQDECVYFAPGESKCTIIMQSCLSVTRELWIDGKRIGVVKGLD